ncbi:MAG TPA: hypothetical protein VGN41_17150 [Streptosporangiaceae bacterium]
MADVTAEGQRSGGASADGTPGEAGAGPATATVAVAGTARPATAARGRAVLAAHWQFAVVALAAVGIRCVVLLGYPPILFYSDSYNYITDAVSKYPDVIRSDGYPLFLYLLLPFRSFTLVAVLQAAMGVAIGVAIYAVLRRRGLPWWGATLAAVPVLFDAFELQLEHLVMSDVLFLFLVTIAIVALCWFDRPPVLICVVAGLLIGYADLVRSVGWPLLIVLAAGLLLRRVNWKRVGLMVVVGLLPIAGYMAWYHGFYGQYALDGSSGSFLYSRVSSFAECSKMSLPQNLKVLCDPTPLAARPPSQEYLWSINTPLYKVSKGNQFSKHADSMAGQFARDAILSQPLAYLRVVADDTLRTFTWKRTQSDITGSGPSFRFRATETPVWANPTLWWVNYYPSDEAALKRYGGPMEGQPKVVQPWADFIEGYQRFFYLRGTMLGAILLIGAAGVVARWRRWGGVALMPWAVGALLVVLPPLTAGFSYRYMLGAVPVACLAAGLALTREPRGRRKVGSPAVGSETASSQPVGS